VATFICPLLRSPTTTKGRIGKTESQDWWQGLLIAAVELTMNPDSIVLIIDDYQAPECDPDADIFFYELSWALGVTENKIVIASNVSEGIDQINAIFKLARDPDPDTILHDIVLISSLLDWPRVWWQTRKEVAVRRRISFGFPNFKEALTELTPSFVFSIFKMIRNQNWSMRKPARRRYFRTL